MQLVFYEVIPTSLILFLDTEREGSILIFFSFLFLFLFLFSLCHSSDHAFGCCIVSSFSPLHTKVIDQHNFVHICYIYSVF